MAVLQPLRGESDAAPHQQKQSSRKSKKAWRKNVDLTEVEKGLDERNLQIIQGGIVAEKPSDDLFTIDLVGDPQNSAGLPNRSKKRGLKVDEIITARSDIPVLPLRKRSSGAMTESLDPAKRRKTGTYVTHKELVRLRSIADGNHESRVYATAASYDVWDAPAESKDATIATVRDPSFLPKTRKVKEPVTLKQKPISLAASGKAIPAIPKPKGGYSYNPAFTDYEERFNKEAAKAVEAERKRIAGAEAERLKLDAAVRSGAEADAAEARAELSEWDEEESAWEGIESGAEELVVKAKKNKVKTRADRNRIRRRKEEERRLKHEAATKRKEDQAARAKELAEEIAEKERQRALERVEMTDGSTSDEEVDLRKRKLGTLGIPEKPLELVLPDELQDSLRLLKPEGNLLQDRYRSLLVRGKVESRKRNPFRKQGKRKLTEKHTYKDFRI